jgi:ABC-type Fe3+-siderophore transport system permease subunit
MPADPNLFAVVRDASTSSVHLAMLVGAALLVAGAIVNAVGIRNPSPKKLEETPASAETGAVSAT